MKIWLPAFIVGCVIAALYLALPAPVTRDAQIGDVLADARMNGLSGQDSSLSAYRGKPLLINVWASWCGPCRDEMASINELARRYGGKQFNVIGISTDDYRDQAAAFLQESNTTFTNYIDDRQALENMLGANRIPLTILVDADGKVLEKVNGSHDWTSPESLKLIEHAFQLAL
ncbi:MAG TPA: TlpA disulfide reductase family protein [Gallionella sp.]|nr:TlpA disulfide reductase family protein [Gallionella sp.]